MDANILLASFGESRGLSSKLFSLVVLRASEPARPQPVRYGKLPEIAHTFKAGPKTPHLVVSLLFVTLIIAMGPNAVGMVSAVSGLRVLADDVATLPRRQSFPPPYCAQVSADCPHHISRLHRCDRVHLLSLLFYVEPVPDAPSGPGARRHHRGQRQSCAKRGAAAPPRGIEIDISSLELAVFFCSYSIKLSSYVVAIVRVARASRFARLPR